MYHILFFSASWCPQCQITKPACISAAAYYKWIFEEVDAENAKNDSLMHKHDIQTLPTIVILKDGAEIYKSFGLKNTKILVDEFASLL